MKRKFMGAKKKRNNEREREGRKEGKREGGREGGRKEGTISMVYKTTSLCYIYIILPEDCVQFLLGLL